MDSMLTSFSFTKRFSHSETLLCCASASHHVDFCQHFTREEASALLEPL